MEFPESEIAEIKKFMNLLNSQKDSVVVVEGKRDSAALIKLGYSGKILEFHRFNGMIKFADLQKTLLDRGFPDLAQVKGKEAIIKEVLAKMSANKIKFNHI